MTSTGVGSFGYQNYGNRPAGMQRSGSKPGGEIDRISQIANQATMTYQGALQDLKKSQPQPKPGGPAKQTGGG